MKDDRYDMDEVERMLSPRCEFRASDVLRPEIMKRARALQEPRRFRLAPWLAAACVAGVVVVSLMRSCRGCRGEPLCGRGCGRHSCAG